MTVFFAIHNDDLNAATELVSGDPSILASRNDRVRFYLLVIHHYYSPQNVED